MLSYVYISLLALAFFAIQILLGGVSPVYSLAAYVPLGVAGLVATASIAGRRVSAGRLCLLSGALFFGFVFLRAAVSPIHYLAQPDFFAALAGLIVYLLTALCLTSPRQRTLFVVGLMLLASMSALLGVVQFARGDNLMLFGLARPDFGPRASGLFASPNHLAGFLQVAGLFSLSIVCWSPWKAWVKVLVSYVAFGCVIGILLTGGLGGYLSAFVGLLVFLGLGVFVMRRLAREQIPVAIILGIFLLSGLLLGTIYFTSTQMLRGRTADAAGGYSHFYLWQAALQQVTVKPLLGTGSGTFPFYARQFRAPQVQADMAHAHNEYLELLAEYGPIGLALFLFFLYAHLHHGWRSLQWLVDHRLRHSGKTRSYSLALSLAALSSVAACGAFSMVAAPLHLPANVLLMAFVAGLLANLGVENSIHTESDAKFNRIFALGLPLLGVAILVLVLPRLPGAYYAERARMAMRERKYSKSIELAKRALDFEKRNPDIYYRLGESNLALAELTPNKLLKQNCYSAASEAFKKGLEIFPKDARLLLAQARNLEVLGLADQAGEFFEKAVQVDPNSSRLRAEYGLHLEQQGRLDESKREYTMAVELDVSNEIARQRLQGVEAQLAAQAPPVVDGQPPEPIGEGPPAKVEAMKMPAFSAGPPH